MDTRKYYLKTLKRLKKEETQEAYRLFYLCFFRFLDPPFKKNYKKRIDNQRLKNLMKVRKIVKKIIN